MNPILRCGLAALLAVTAISCSRQTLAQDEGPHPETGKVVWGRDFKSTLAESRLSGKPIFALFQEVPGCNGCKRFGRDVLSDPVIVRGIETEFTPLLIHNNTPGPDAEILQQYGETPWSYQVVRFLDADGRDLIPRKDHVWESAPLAARMIATLEKAGRPVPEYLKTVASESPAPAQ